MEEERGFAADGEAGGEHLGCVTRRAGRTELSDGNDTEVAEVLQDSCVRYCELVVSQWIEVVMGRGGESARTFRALKNRLLDKLARRPVHGNANSENDAIITPSTIGHNDISCRLFGLGLARIRAKRTVKTGSEAFTVCEKDGCITRKE